ncbi:hypothetical protein [Psychromonas sp. SR45-3]|uniref:hypothetical protein n=1 Tax=Psychromonas sp. SR45-3 TaxID=2760930 RepID=UPI0015F9F0EE|nr:hypothetical protein [Psychromonas sp. SR45-3]MBB1274042.1 hypothetical protein [Psychromonas sp. SR45-3]
MKKENVQRNAVFNHLMTLCAWIAFILILLVLAKGDQILQSVAIIYPEFALPAFFIPWFLLVISSVQKLRESLSKAPLQSWILKTTVPIFIFVLPFFTTWLTSSLTGHHETIGFEGYCVYLAILVLFMVHFLPVFNTKQVLVK